MAPRVAMDVFEQVAKPFVDLTSVSFDLEAEDAMRAHRVQWTVYRQLISESNMSMLVRFDRQSPDTQRELWEQSGPQLASAFTAVLRNVNAADTLQYTLMVLHNQLKQNDAYARYFLAVTAERVDPYAALIRVLNRNNWITIKYGSLVVSRLLFAARDVVPSFHFKTVAMWYADALRSKGLGDAGLVPLLDGLSYVLRQNEARLAFAQSGGLERLSMFLHPQSSSVQLLYLIGLNVWLVSFCDAAVPLMNVGSLFKGMVDITKSFPKEKVVRVVLAAFANIAKAHVHNEDLIELGLLKSSQMLMNATWNDEDIPEDVKRVVETLSEDVKQLTSFEKYEHELTSGRLSWSPAHTDEQFWIENINKFETREFELIKILVKNLSSDNPVRVCIALNDLGYFASHHARGKRVIENLGGKTQIMELVMSSNNDIRRQAINCTQRMLALKKQFVV